MDSWRPIYKMPRDVKSGTCVFYPTVLLWQQKYSADYQIHLLIFNIFFYPLWVLAEMNFNVSSGWNWQKSFKHLKRGNGSFYISMQREPFNLLKNVMITFLPKKFSFNFFLKEHFIDIMLSRSNEDTVMAILKLSILLLLFSYHTVLWADSGFSCSIKC